MRRLFHKVLPVTRSSTNCAGAIHAINFNGTTILCRTDNKIEKTLIYDAASYDRVNFTIVNAFIHLGSICFDVGANIGVYSMVMSRLSGKDGVVHAFEPVRHIRNRLLTNKIVNAAHNIIVSDSALGNSQGRMLMFQVKENQFRGGTSTLIKNNNVDSMGEGAFEIVLTQVNTLDNYVSDRGLLRVDFMKIDVEGFEINVLRGAHTVLGAFHPVILFEHDQRRLSKLGIDDTEFREIFVESGYSVFEPSLSKGVLRLLPFAFDRKIGTNNLLAIPAVG